MFSGKKTVSYCYKCNQCSCISNVVRAKTNSHKAFPNFSVNPNNLLLSFPQTPPNEFHFKVTEYIGLHL